MTPEQIATVDVAVEVAQEKNWLGGGEMAKTLVNLYLIGTVLLMIIRVKRIVRIDMLYQEGMAGEEIFLEWKFLTYIQIVISQL